MRFAPANQLSIELPSNRVPMVDRGMVVRAEPVGEQTRRWLIELGGHHCFRLRILPANGNGQHSQLALLRESRTYDLSLRGLEASAQWRLQVHNEPLQEVAVLLDLGLQLASAQCGENTLAWSAAPTADGQATRVVLMLPEPVCDTERVIRLSALGQLVFDRPWRLPRIRAEGLFWQEANITLLTPEPLVADRIVPLGCRQTGTGSLSSPRAGESLQFQAFEPDATVEVLLSRQATTLQVLSAAAVEMGTEEVAARVTADFRITQGAKFAIEADVAQDWVVDGVESMPANVVTDWRLAPRPNGGQLLTVYLGEGLSATKPLRLTLVARRLLSPTKQALGIDDLPPLRFQDAANTKRLIAVRPAASYALRLSGAERLKRLQPDRLAPAELALFAELPQDLLFEDSPQANGLEIALIGQEARYTGTIQIDAAVDDGAIREDYLVRCVPQLGHVDRVLVQLFARRDMAPLWTLGSDGDRQVSARKWSDEEQAAAGWDDSIETWELTLRRPQSGPFEIRATRDVPIGSGKPTAAASGDEGPITLPLASLPEATSQRGTLTIRHMGSESLRIDHRRLRPVPPEPIPPDRLQSVAGVFRYDPARDMAEGAAAVVRVVREEESGNARAWVWNCHLESWCQPDGATTHRATYRLENSGCRYFWLTMPTDVDRRDIHGIWINGDPVSWQTVVTGKTNRLTVPLPADRRYVSVTIRWSASGPRMGIVGSLSASLPRPDLPILTGYWTVWLPPGYEFVASNTSSSSAFRGSDITWRRRLFGPLGRSRGTDRFHPLSASDWMAPLGTSALATEGLDEREPAKLGLPWASGDSASDSEGWTTQRMPLFAGTPTALGYVHSASMRLFGTVMLLLVAAAGCWKMVDRPVLLVLLLGGFGAAAMVLPAAYASMASGGVLGILLCLAWRWTRSESPPPIATDDTSIQDPNAPASGSAVTVAARLGSIVLGMLLTLLVGRAAHGQPPPKPRAAAPAMHRVFVPIDARKKPTGRMVYVPEPLYRELYRRAAASDTSRDWLILKATYRGVLAAEAASGRMAVDTLRAQYDLHVRGHSTRVRIPLGEEDAAVLPGGVLLDGRPIEWEWEPDAAALAVEVSEPGECRLEVLLRPTVYNVTGTAGIDLTIPRVARSRLELTIPEGAPAVEVPTALGLVRKEEEPPRLLAHLGPADRLMIRWQKDAAPGTIDRAVDAQQLTWLNVQPGSVVVAAKFKLHLLEGRIQQVQLAVDPRLRLLPLAGDDPPSVRMGPESGQSRRITFRWPRPISNQITLETTFFLSGATGVGKFRLPRIELLDIQPTKHWMAVSVVPTLDREEQQEQRLGTVPVSDFMKAWGTADTKPLVAYRLSAEESDWSISTRPREPSSLVDQMLTVCCDEDHADLIFEARVSTTSGYLFQHRLTAPPGLKIEDVSLTEEDVERVSRWSQNADGAITVFLNDAVSGQHELVLRGQLPISLGKPWPLPWIRVEQCRVRQAKTRLLRRPSVLLTVRDGQKHAMAQPALSADSSQSGLGRLVGVFSWDGSQSPDVTVTTENNRPKVQALETVWMRRDGPSWTAGMDGRVSVREGVVDQFDIRAPVGWNGPYEVNPPGQLQIHKSAGEVPRLVYRPQAAIGGDFEFSISSLLEPDRGERPRVPDVGLLDVDQQCRWFVLPDQAQGQSIRWRTRGLRATSWPEHLAGSLDSGATAYEVVQEPVQAVLEPTDAPCGAGFVWLADVTTIWRADGSRYGASVFDLQPEGTSECPLRLPDGDELVQVSVEGMRVTPQAVGDGTWRFPLVSQSLPQRVEVLFRSDPPVAANGRRTFEAPALGDLPVRQTLWTIIGPHSWKMNQPDTTTTVSVWQQELSRLKSAAVGLERACEVSSDDADEATRWPWVRRFAVSRAALQRALEAADNSNDVALAKKEADAVERKTTELAKRLNFAEPFDRALSTASVDTNLGGILQSLPDTAQPLVRCAFHDRMDSLTLDCQHAEPDPFSHRLGFAAMLVMLTCLAAVGLARGNLTEKLRRWPHILGVVLGLVWWLWLWPSILGLGIVLASILAAGWTRMRTTD